MRLWPTWYQPPGAPRQLPRVAIANRMVRYAAIAINVTPEDLMGPSRGGSLVGARAAISAALRARGWSYPRIGRALNRNHSSIMNCIGKLDYYAGRWPELAPVIENLAAMSRN